jgi:broad specificity phosphatase PhoE
MGLKNPSKYEANKTILLLIRHGDRIIIPNTKSPHDFSLSKKGISQSKSLAKELSKFRGQIDVLYSSPMKRAKETAKILGKEIRKKPLILKGFEEVPKILEKPNYFSLNYWKERRDLNKKERIFNRILEKNKGKVIVLVAHGRLNRMLIGMKLGLSYKKSNIFDSENCHILCARFKDKKLEYIYCINSKYLFPLFK